jgi:hypothetical protein
MSIFKGFISTNVLCHAEFLQNVADGSWLERRDCTYMTFLFPLLTSVEAYIWQPVFLKILHQVPAIIKLGKSVVVCWVPGRTGLPSKESTDAAAKKAALEQDETSERPLGMDVCVHLHIALFTFLQDEWTHTQDRKLWAVKPSFKVWQSSSSSVRKEEVLLMCLWTGYNGLMCGHLWHGEPLPLYTLVYSLPSHLLVECLHHNEDHCVFLP